MTDKTKTNLSIDLLENGIDFVLKGIDELFDDESILRISVDPTELNLSNFKYGILHVFSGFFTFANGKTLSASTRINF